MCVKNDVSVRQLKSGFARSELMQKYMLFLNDLEVFDKSCRLCWFTGRSWYHRDGRARGLVGSRQYSLLLSTLAERCVLVDMLKWLFC